MFYHTIAYNFIVKDSLDDCTSGGLYCSIEPIANGFHPTMHKVNLQNV